MILDLHTHTQYSYDAEARPVIDHVQHAVQKGVSILGFTEHVEFFRKDSIQASDFVSGTVDFVGYQKEIEPFRTGRTIMPDLASEQKDIFAAQEVYGEQITLRAGVEIGQPHAAPEQARALIQTYPFDYVIGSIHQLSDDMDLYFYRYETIHPDEFWEKYFAEVRELLAFGHIQILAHLDYPLRVMKLPHNQPSLKGYMNYVDEVLKLLIAKDIALESNTKGLYGWQQEVGPEAFVLTRYRELGGELITVGSDSHAPETVARGIPRALERLRAAGFRAVTDFENKNIIQHAIA